MLAQACRDEPYDFARNLLGKLDESLQDLRRGEMPLLPEYGCFAVDRPAFPVIHAVVIEAPVHLPPDRALVAVLPVAQLESRGLAVVPEPNQEVLLVGKEPPAARLAGLLLDPGHFVEKSRALQES